MPTAINTLWKSEWRSAAAARQRRNRFATARIPRLVFKRQRRPFPNRRSNIVAIRISHCETKVRLRLFRLDYLEFACERRFAEDDEGGRGARIRRTGSVKIRRRTGPGLQGQRNSRARDRERRESSRSTDSEWQIRQGIWNTPAADSRLRNGRRCGENGSERYEIEGRRSGLRLSALGRRLGRILYLE